MTLFLNVFYDAGVSYDAFFFKCFLGFYDVVISFGLYDADISTYLYDVSFLSICLYDAEVSLGLYDGSFGVF